jgi:glycosidase
VKSELDYLVKTGVGNVYISSFFASPKAATSGLMFIDYRQEDSTFESLEYWKALVMSLKERDQKVNIVDFIPYNTSDQHEWFEKSAGVYILPKNVIVFHVRILKILISFHVLLKYVNFLGVA